MTLQQHTSRMWREFILLGLLLYLPASEGVKFDCLYNLGNIIFYGSWSGFYTILWSNSSCNRNMTDHGHVLRVDDNILMISNFSMDINDITGEDRNGESHIFLLKDFSLINKFQ